ncbi:helix-turn-helix domain-containing protein [Novosphingobium sp. FSY-8]|uniref:Helix-turn-helix domain-containing protein n=2 Tax=Novosphingobium ovatum TaxID=1908523 RepID=A0ABW9XBY8_9SPHN|nr:helix-turn-helix domain-containing protein [Novosphingobium ovatum]
MTDAPHIPNFALYGEGEEPNPAGFCHIETIAVRSSLHDWEINPHRHDRGIQVLIVHSGEALVTLDGESFTLPQPGFVAIPAGAVHGYRFAPGMLGYVLTLSQDIAARATGGNDPLRSLLSAGGHGPLDSESARRCGVLAEEMLSLAQEWQGGGMLELALAEALLRSLPQGSMSIPRNSEDDRRLAHFRLLVETHLKEHRPLSFFADAIGTTERTLGRLCRRRLGCSPLEVINRRCTLEAQRLLRYTNATVAQVSTELGFADPSYFSRFYLRMTGRRPQAERSALTED